MGEYKDANANDILITHIEAIADAICGSDEAASYNTDRLRHALGRIAEHFTEKPLGEQLPAVKTTDNGSVLKVSGGKWAIGTDAGLPAVTAADNGSILKVVDGAWAVVVPDP